MIPRLKGIIDHSHDTKLLEEDGEDAEADWGTRPSPKAKPFREDPRDTPTCVWGNKPNPKKDSIGIDVQGRRNNRLEKGEEGKSVLIPPKAKPTRRVSRQSTRKKSYVRQRGKQSSPKKVYTRSTTSKGQTNGCGNTAGGYPVSRRGAAVGEQTDGCIH